MRSRLNNKQIRLKGAAKIRINIECKRPIQPLVSFGKKLSGWVRFEN